MYAGDQENIWNIENGCSNHMTCEKYKFIFFHEINKENNVTFNNKSPAAIRGK